MRVPLFMLLTGALLCLGISGCSVGVRPSVDFHDQDFSFKQVQPVPEKAPGSVRVMTYNINWGMNAPAECLKAIEISKADVVLLQETTPYWESFLTPRLRQTYPHISFRHWYGAGGMALLSKYPVEEKAYVLPEKAWFPAWIVEAKTPVGDLQLVNVHLRPPLTDRGSVGFMGSAVYSTRRQRLREVQGVSGAVQAGMPTVFGGDFNESDGGKAVVWLQSNDYRDAVTGASADYTWRWPLGYLVLTGEYDHLVFSPQLECIQAHIIHLGGSDHYPVLADFARKPEEKP